MQERTSYRQRMFMAYLFYLSSYSIQEIRLELYRSFY